MTVKEDLLHDLLFRSIERYVKLKLKYDQEFNDQPIKRKKPCIVPKSLPEPEFSEPCRSEQDFIDFINNQ